MIKRALALALVLGISSPALAQRTTVSQLPAAGTLTGAEKIPASQGSNCTGTGTPSCTTVAMTPAQIGTYLGPLFQAADPDLSAISGLTTSADSCLYWTGPQAVSLYPCSPFYRGLGGYADAPTTRTALGLGTMSTQSAAGVAITGGTITSITDLALADGGTGASTAAGARTNLGLGTSATVNTGTSGATIPLLSTANTWAAAQTFSVTATGSVSGNAGTATKLATGRTISITGDLTYTSPTFDGSAAVTAAGILATVNANTGTVGSATAIPVLTLDAKGRVTAATTVGTRARIPFVKRVRTSGNATVTGGSTFAAFDTTMDITLAAAAGDVIQCGIQGEAADASPGNIEFNVATMVSGSQVNLWGSTFALIGWAIHANDYWTTTGNSRYVVVAGDLSAGAVTLRLLARVDGSTGTRSIFAQTGLPFTFDCANLGAGV